MAHGNTCQTHLVHQVISSSICQIHQVHQVYLVVYAKYNQVHASTRKNTALHLIFFTQDWKKYFKSNRRVFLKILNFFLVSLKNFEFSWIRQFFLIYLQFFFFLVSLKIYNFWFR